MVFHNFLWVEILKHCHFTIIIILSSIKIDLWVIINKSETSLLVENTQTIKIIKLD